MHTVQFLTTLVEHHRELAYGLVFLGVLLEGEMFLICTGILLHLGAFIWLPAMLVAFVGAFCKTFLGYYIGMIVKKRWSHVGFFKFFEKRVRRVVPKFKQKPFWSIFLSKFILGANHIVVLFAGFEGISFKKYLRAETISTIIWVPFMTLLGYLFSYTALHVSHEIYRFSLVVLVLFILFILFDKLISWLYELFEELYDNHEQA